MVHRAHGAVPPQRTAARNDGRDLRQRESWRRAAFAGIARRTPSNRATFAVVRDRVFPLVDLLDGRRIGGRVRDVAFEVAVNWTPERRGGEKE